MEQLINTATPYFYAMLGFWGFGIAIIFTSASVFIVSEMTAGKESLIMFILGVLLFISGVHFSNMYNKYNDQMIAIVKPIISENYPEATDFSYCIKVGHFTNDGTTYKIGYQKTISDKEKLIISTKKQFDDTNDKQVTTLDIPKGTKNNESTND